MAEADRDLESLLQRMNEFIRITPIAIRQAIKVGDFEKAKKLENSMYEANEIMGRIRWHGFSSRFGPSDQIGKYRHDARSDEGKFAQRGSQGDLLGSLKKTQTILGVMYKAAPQPGVQPYPNTQLQASKKNPMVRRWQGQEGQQPTQAQQAQAPKEDASHEAIVRHIAGFIGPFENAMHQLKSVAGDLGNVKGRLKDPHSLGEKTSREQNIIDVAGVRLITPDWQSLEEAVQRIKENFDVVEENDYINKKHRRDIGYRAYHFVIEQDGKQVELQVRTENQDRWADWQHDTLYKGEQQEDKELLEYSRQISDYFMALDKGEEAEPPDCPPELRQRNLCLEGMPNDLHGQSA